MHNGFGYIISKNSGSQFYIINLSDYLEAEFINYESNEKVKFYNLEISDYTKLTNLYDLIKKDSINIQNRTFWGWSCGGTYEIGEGTCFANCCYYVLWIQTRCDVFTCSNMPGNHQQ